MRLLLRRRRRARSRRCRWRRGKSRFQMRVAGMAFEAGMQNPRDARPGLPASARCRARSSGAVRAARPSSAGRAAPGRRRPGPAQQPSVMKVSCEPLPAGRIGRNRAEQHVGMPGRVFRRRMDRYVDADGRAAGNRAASPRCCPSSTMAPRCMRGPAIAGISCISNVLEPGDSVNTTLVFGFISAAMPAPTCGS